MRNRYIVVAANIVGTLENYEHVYHSDGATYSTRRQAIRAGFALRGSDDFNIGVITPGGQIIELWWMGEQINETPEVLVDISKKLGFS